MGKITAFTLSLALSLSLCVPAFAAESTVTETGGKQEIDVNIQFRTCVGELHCAQ